MNDHLWGYVYPFGKVHVVGWHPLDGGRKFPVTICNTASVHRPDDIVRLYPPFLRGNLCGNCLRIMEAGRAR